MVNTDVSVLKSVEKCQCLKMLEKNWLIIRYNWDEGFVLSFKVKFNEYKATLL